MTAKEDDDARKDIIEKKASCQLKCGVFLIIFATVIELFGVIFVPRIIQRKVTQGIADQYVPYNGTKEYNSWVKNDLPDAAYQVYAFHFFHLTNVDEVLYHEGIPNVEKKGPFLYRYHRHRLDVEYDADNGEVSFWNREFYTPLDSYNFINNDGSIREMKSLDGNNENITMINAVFYAVAFEGVDDPFHTSKFDVCRDVEPLGIPLLCLDALLTLVNASVVSMLTEGGPQYGLFPTRTANQWLGIMPEDAFESRCLKLLAPVRHEADANWGFMYNDSQASDNITREHCHRERVRFDRSDLQRAQSMVTFAGNEVLYSLDQFNSNHSRLNVLNYQKQFAGWGDDLPIGDHEPVLLTGAYTHPKVGKDEQLIFWTDSAARGAPFSFNATTNILGVDVYTYTPRYDDLVNTTYNKHMYYSPSLGLFNMSQMHQYSPVMISTPHFYDYPNVLAEFPITGLREPNKVLDATFADIEPNSGLVVSGVERIQLNLLTPKTGWDFDSIGLEYKLRNNTLHPLMIMEKYGQLNDHDASMLRELQLVETYEHDIRLICGVCGAIIGIFGVFLVLGAVEFHRRATFKEEKRLLKLPSSSTTSSVSSSSSPHYGTTSFADVQLSNSEDTNDEW